MRGCIAIAVLVALAPACSSADPEYSRPADVLDPATSMAKSFGTPAKIEIVHAPASKVRAIMHTGSLEADTDGRVWVAQATGRFRDCPLDDAKRFRTGPCDTLTLVLPEHLLLTGIPASTFRRLGRARVFS